MTPDEIKQAIDTLVAEKDAKIAVWKSSAEAMTIVNQRLTAELAACKGTTPAPAPDPAPTGGVLGVYEGGFPGDPDLTKFEGLVGPVSLAMNFQGTWDAIRTGGGAYPHWQAWLNGDPARRAVLSVGLGLKAKGTDLGDRTRLRDGAGGAHDGSWHEFARSLATVPGLSDAYIRLGWEFNGGWYGWRAALDPVAFCAYWRRVVGIVREVCPDVRFVWCASMSNNTPYLRDGSGRNVGPIDAAYPGDDVVDLIGADIYDMRGNRSPLQGWAEVTEPALDWLWNFAEEHGKKWCLGEWGLWDASRNPNTPDNPYYIEGMHDWISLPDCEFAVYFNADAQDGRHSLTSGEFPAAARKMAELEWRTRD